MQAEVIEFPVLPSIQRVMSKARSVRFHPEFLSAAVAEWGRRVDPISAWNHPCHPGGGGREVLQWLFVLDVLNHCFWPDRSEVPWTVEIGAVSYSGYWGLAAALKRGLDEKVPLTEAAFLAGMKRSDLLHLFRGQGSLPLLEERLFNLNEAGRVLLDRWQGHIVHLLEESRGNALKTVLNLVDSFPSFRDESTYDGKRVFFWKRAQLFVSDVNQAFSGAGWGAFHQLDELTAFADYKLPQVLRELRLISYEESLAERVDSYGEIEPGSKEEVEIRAATIWAVEHLKSEFQRQGRLVNSPWVDNWLWNLGQLDAFRRRPYHRCRTIYY